MKLRLYAMKGNITSNRHVGTWLRYQVFRRGYIAGQFRRRPTCPIADGELRYYWRWGCEWGTAVRRFYATRRKGVEPRLESLEWPQCRVYGKPAKAGREQSVVGRIGGGQWLPLMAGMAGIALARHNFRKGS